MTQEYDSVVLAALLHDIGKFSQRGSSESARHWEFSAAFVERFRCAFEDPELVKALVGHHHERSDLPADARPNAIDDARTRALAYLVSRADSFSSQERPDAQRTGGYRPRSPLHTVFAQVDIGSETADAYDGSNFVYQLAPLQSGNHFPVEVEPDFQIDEREFESYHDSFISDFSRCFTEPYPRMADSLLSLLQKYLWCVPSDTTLEMRDVSLADHMKSTCALAACAYKWHEENGWDEAIVKDDSQARWRLVCGDLSGIQNYIYGITSVGPGGVAKRLRGRSFRISTLTEAVALRILLALDLPMACRIMAAGGQFYMIVPNTTAAVTALEELRRSISRWVLEEFTGELAVAFDSVEFTGHMLAQQQFGAVLEEVRAKVARAKLRKFEDVLADGPKVFDLDFGGARDCPVCEINPSSGLEDDGTAKPCGRCELDAALGRRLASAGWLVFSEQPGGGGVSFFDERPLYAILAQAEEDVRRLNPVVAYSLRGSDILHGVPCAFAPYAGYVARWKDAQEFQAAAAAHREIAENEQHDERELNSGQVVKTFTALAHSSQGAALLGVLRADVDHLGLIFSLGMKGRSSLGRLATLSSLMNIFFSHELVRLIQSEFPDTYVAYAGGDDLMLVGPWEKTIELAKRIVDEFRRYVAGNPNITLSAGIGTYKPRVPIATSSQQTGEILETAKDRGRNRLSVFETTFEWDRFDRVKQWAHKLANSLQCQRSNGGGISSGFLYALLGWQENAMEFYSVGTGESAMFKPRLAYSLGRNYIDNEGNPKIDKELFNMLLGLVGPAGKQDWEILKAAVTWAAYRVRKEESR